jgi:hypothetical protein
MPSPNLDELTTTTLRNRRPAFRDNFTNSTALFSKLSAKDRVEELDGGRSIVEPIMYAENTNFTFYTDYESLPVSAHEGISAAEFDWKQAAVSVVISGAEIRKNAGKSAIKSLLKSRIEIAEKTMINQLGAASYGDGTAYSGKTLGGLQAYVSTTPTSGTVGGINRATYSFWRNVAKRSSVDYGGAAISTTIQSHMNRTYLEVLRGREKTDLIVCDNTSYRLYLESLQAIQRITKPSSAQDAGYLELQFMGASVIPDGGKGGSCPANYMYFLNTEYLKLCVHKDMFMDCIDPEMRAPTNQDGVVKIIGFMGNITVGNCQLQAVLRVD